MALLLAVAPGGECSLQRACCRGSFADVLAEPTCAAMVAAGGAGATFGIPLALGFLGFTVTGPVAGGLAALWQSTGMFAGLFSTLQSVAMTGLGYKAAATGASAAYALCCADVRC